MHREALSALKEVNDTLLAQEAAILIGINKILYNKELSARNMRNLQKKTHNIKDLNALARLRMQERDMKRPARDTMPTDKGQYPSGYQ